MTRASPAVPLWAEPYLPDFAALRQVIERSGHFFLQPVETPSPDLARIFADWLRADGWAVRLVELRAVEAWGRLAEALQEDLEESQGRPRAVIVSAPYDLDAGVMRGAMARVNMQRDSIVAHLDAPLLWCGSRAFQQYTWEYAPDFWSIASTPYRIPLRDLTDTYPDNSASTLWWTGAVSDDVAALEAAFARCVEDGSNRSEAARVGLRLAECQLARGDLGAAAQVLAVVRPWLDGGLDLRWRALFKAIGAAKAAPPDRDLEQLRARLVEAKARGGRRVEASLRVALAERLRDLRDADMARAARDELYQARALFGGLGDDLAVARVDEILTRFDDAPAPEMMAAMAGSAEALLRASEDPEVRRIATLVLVRVYLWQQRLADAERIVDKALAEGSGRGGASAAYTINLLHAKSVLASERGDWPRVHALTSKIIAIAERGQISELARRIRMERAAACRGMGKPLHACVDLLVSAAMARTSSHFVHAFLAAQDASGLAVSLGVPRVAAVLQLWSMIALLHGLSAGALVGRAVDTAGLRAAGETELAERLDALGRWIAEEMPGASAPAVQGKLVEFGREFQEMFDVREAELRSQGIDAMDPMTWGVAEEPPVAHAEA